MIFSFLKFVKPIWYFNLRPAVDHGYFTPPQLPTYEVDRRFESSEAQIRDVSWQAFHKGLVALEHKPRHQAFDPWTEPDLPVADEYRFLVKYFHPGWSLYVLLIRLLSGKRPWREWRAWRTAKATMKRQAGFVPIDYESYPVFRSRLIMSQPLVSVVIPTLNRYDYLHDVLDDLARQTYKNMEVIVVDQSHPFRPEFYEVWPFKLKFWHQKERALWRARNEAIRTARGQYLLLYDDDSRVEPDWVEQHLKALDFFRADISSGVSLSQVGEKVPAHYSYFRWSDQLDTGNVLIRREVFEQVGLFDRQFEKQRMGDGEFGLRAYLAGFRNISNPLAKRVHLKVAGGGLREMGSWDSWRPSRWWAPRPIPSVLYFTRSYFGDLNSRLYALANVIPSFVPYRYKGRKERILMTALISILVWPLLALQVTRSWVLSSKKLREGNRIEWLTRMNML